jgi:hypothetical protein
LSCGPWVSVLLCLKVVLGLATGLMWGLMRGLIPGLLIGVVLWLLRLPHTEASTIGVRFFGAHTVSGHGPCRNSCGPPPLAISIKVFLTHGIELENCFYVTSQTFLLLKRKATANGLRFPLMSTISSSSVHHCILCRRFASSLLLLCAPSSFLGPSACLNIR